jgi:hypothetical protein
MIARDIIAKAVRFGLKWADPSVVRRSRQASMLTAIRFFHS